MYQLLIITIVAFLLINFIKCRNFYNGMFLFNFIWLFMLILYKFKLSYLLTELNSRTIQILIIMIVSFNIVYLLTTAVMNIGKTTKKCSLHDIRDKYLSQKIIYKLFYLWSFLIIVEIIVSGGLPVIWKIIGNNKTYFDFGIANIHGFVNSLALTINLMACAYYLFIRKNKFMVKIIITILVTYTLLISRQVIITSLIEMAFLLFYYYKTIGKKIRIGRCVAIGTISTVLFGIVGNFRTGLENFYRVAFIINPVSSIFSGFYWVYMYFVMTIANINYVISNGYINIYSTSIFNFFERGSIAYSSKDYLVSKAFTVSGFFTKYLIWDGIVGVIAISAIYACISAVTYTYFIKKRSLHSLLMYAVTIQIILMTFFTDMLFYLPCSFQFVLLILIYIFTKYKFVYK